jgi:chromosome segregation ATPase
MVQPGIGLDTPRTNLGDATYLSHQPDFDISQEASFQSPSKDNNIFQQLQYGRRGAINLKTPRSRVPFGDKKNLPHNAFNAGEFTPLLKSATRNSALKFGKENGIPQTPAFLRPGGLDNIPEDTPLPHMSSSVYGGDDRNGSYVNGTPVPQFDSSSAASTPMAFPPRRNDSNNVLQDGNQLSLREQENIIDKIEKENFGLKLKIHFLEEALRKAGPGFSEAALKENTELKVDKVTMQKELHRYRKTLTTAERDLETYRQQILEMQEKVKRKHASEGQREELERLQRVLQDKESEVLDLQEQLRAAERQDGQVEKQLRDEIGDLEADLREKDRAIEERDGELDSLKETISAAKRREIELEEQAQSGEDLEEAKQTIEEMERDIERLKAELEESRQECHAAKTEKRRAETDLEELQDEMANKSITTKGLSRQIEEKANRLQDEVEDLREAHTKLEKQHTSKAQEVETLLKKVENYQSLEEELRRKADEKDLLQVRHDALTAECAGLQKDLARARASVEELEDKLDHEKTLALKNEREVRDQYKSEIDRLNDEIEDLRADVREKERLYDDDADKWESERRNLESQRDRAEEQAAGLKRIVDSLQEAEGNLSSKESKLQQSLDSEKERHSREEAILTRQIEELNQDLESRQQALEDVRSELSTVREELRLSQREQKSLFEKVQGLEDEVEVLQSSLDEDSDRAQASLAAAKEESESLRQELQDLRKDVDLQSSQGPKEQLTWKLRDAETQLAKVKKDKQDLQDQLAQLNIEMHTLRTKAADVEAERDEFQSRLKEMKQHEEDTFRLDQEKIELRTSKMKLDSEVRRLRDEIKALTERHRTAENELQQEVERANIEEARLTNEIANVRQKETEYIQRESAQKDVLRNLKRQITELERKAHDLEVSRMQTASPHSSTSSSARKSEIIEVRHQLATAHQTLKELRAQLKDVERDSARKLSAATLDLQTKTSAWDAEKFDLEHDLAQATHAREELQAKNSTAEQTTARLRSKIDRLEKELQAERRNANEDRTLALERRDLHDMLRESQIQAEELELVVKDRESTIAKISAAETELRLQLKRVRDERATHRERALKASQQLDDLEVRFRRAKESWEEEKRTLSRGVRFPNMSVSDRSPNDSLVREGEEREKRHVKELRGLMMQIEWLRARCRREEGLRADAAYAKRFMMLQVELFGAWLVLFPSSLAFIVDFDLCKSFWRSNLLANMITVTWRIFKCSSRWALRLIGRCMRRGLPSKKWQSWSGLRCA